LGFTAVLAGVVDYGVNTADAAVLDEVE